MVLGLRSNARKGQTVQLDYVIHIQEIKLWSPSLSLKTLRSAVIQWEHGNRNSGLTKPAVPLLGSGSNAGNGKIEFIESFNLHATLVQNMSVKGRDRDSFQKNCIEFNLYEPRRDKKVMGQLLGTAVLDLADYGIVKETLSISTPINCKRTYGNASQPLLFLKIQPVDKNQTSPSSKDYLMKEALMDRNLCDCVSEQAEEAEVASYTTDDDVSSQSSLAATPAADSDGSLSPQHKKIRDVAENITAEDFNVKPAINHFVSDLDLKKTDETNGNLIENLSRSSTRDLTSDLSWISRKISSQSLRSSGSVEIEKDKCSNNNSSSNADEPERRIQGNIVDGDRDLTTRQNLAESLLSCSITQEKFVDFVDRFSGHLDSSLNHCLDNACSPNAHPDELLLSGDSSSSQTSFPENETIENNQMLAKEKTEGEKEEQYIDNPLSSFSQVDVRNQVNLYNGLVSHSVENSACCSDFSANYKSKHGKSVRSSPHSIKRNGSVCDNEHKDIKPVTKETTDLDSEGKIQLLEHRIKCMEAELQEAAAIEISLYCMVAEHGNSITKVLAPARRLSRLYFHSCRQKLNSRRGSTSKSIVSGLVLVAKACGHDVPRLTFWLSNSVALRIFVCDFLEGSELSESVEPVSRKIGNMSGKRSKLKWESFPSKGTKSFTEGRFGECENHRTFVTALEKFESWLFSRIVESIWWQTFTPYMQPDTGKSLNRSTDADSSNLCYSEPSSSERQQGNFSLELWKKAFRDAVERICPIRAGGHECGCLSLLSRLIMEQLIARLDVAMFNALLRESGNEIPTDPMADPISDPDVLPIPAGNASFGAGALLKNAIGHWTRWLTDFSGFDPNALLGHENHSETSNGDEKRSNDTTSKSFHLLDSLSDLMMLPKDLLLSSTIRKEVCPTFGPHLIRKVLDFFIPDEFCPDPIPRVVLEALDSEDRFDSAEDSIINFPCPAAPIIYQPPSATAIGDFSGQLNGHPRLTYNRYSMLKKSQTSDDELDELDSPLKSINLDIFQASPSNHDNGSRFSLRYQLLREVWMESKENR